VTQLASKHRIDLSAQVRALSELVDSHVATTAGGDVRAGEYLKTVFASEFDSLGSSSGESDTGPEAAGRTEAAPAHASVLDVHMMNLLGAHLRYLLRRGFNSEPLPRDSTPCDPSTSERSGLFGMQQMGTEEGDEDNISDMNEDDVTMNHSDATAAEGEVHCCDTEKQVGLAAHESFDSLAAVANDTDMNVINSVMNEGEEEEEEDTDDDDDEGDWDAEHTQGSNDSSDSQDNEYGREPTRRFELVMDPDSKSFNTDDLASLVHRALRCVQWLRPLAQQLIFSGIEDLKLEDHMVTLCGVHRLIEDECDVFDMLHAFTISHEFLSNVFAGDALVTLSHMIDADRVCWAKLHKYTSMIREYDIEELKPLTAFSNLGRFAMQLEKMDTLAALAKSAVQDRDKVETKLQMTASVKKKRRRFGAGSSSGGRRLSMLVSVGARKQRWKFPKVDLGNDERLVEEGVWACTCCGGGIDPGHGDWVACVTCLQRAHASCCPTPSTDGVPRPRVASHTCEKCNTAAEMIVSSSS
jgi:hypothetical protein